MDIKELKIAKSDGKGIIYDCDKVKLVVRKKGSINADHVHPEGENMFFIEGEVELTVGGETRRLKSPFQVEISPNIYHKIIALTDIKLLYYWL